MSRLVARFDPSAKSGDTVNVGIINRDSSLLICNESSFFLKLTVGQAGDTLVVQPWYNLLIRHLDPMQDIQWSQDGALQSGSAPASLVYIIRYDPREYVSDNWNQSLSSRLNNVGNAAAVSSSATSVQNDGAAAGTTVVEGTPTGAGSSDLLLTNDGQATLGGGKLKINASGVVTLIPAGAIPASGVASGYPAADIGAGALPAGVTIAEGQVGGGYPAAYIGAGALPSGVTIPASQVTNQPQTIPTIRNGALTLVNEYTGTATPVGDGVTTPQTGAVWFKV